MPRITGIGLRRSGASDRSSTLTRQRCSNFDAVFRHVLCTKSVCRIDLRWSPELSDAYNGGLIKVVEEFSRELAFVPDGELNQMFSPTRISSRSETA